MVISGLPAARKRTPPLATGCRSTVRARPSGRFGLEFLRFRSRYFILPISRYLSHREETARGRCHHPRRSECVCQSRANENSANRGSVKTTTSEGGWVVSKARRRIRSSVQAVRHKTGSEEGTGNGFTRRSCDSPTSYCNFAYSALACFRMGMSGSASFQRLRKSW